jgi:hypothetical protein
MVDRREGAMMFRAPYFSAMILEVRPWSQRKLEFNRSLEELPVLAERLLGTSDRITALLRNVPQERLQLRLQGKWSVLEHIGHLMVMDDRMQVRVEDWLSLSGRLTPIELADQQAQLDGQRHRELGDMVEEFRITRQAFVDNVLNMPPTVHTHYALHPCMHVRMRPTDMFHFLAEHDDHHLATLRRIVRAE